MALHYASVVLCGVAATDPLVRLAGVGQVATFTIAVNDRRKGHDGAWIDEAITLEVEATGELAEQAASLVRGGLAVTIHGKLRNRVTGDRRALRVVATELRVELPAPPPRPVAKLPPAVAADLFSGLPEVNEPDPV